MKIPEKFVLVTGASRGIGAAIAREFAQRGARLTIAARNRDTLDNLAKEIHAAGHERPEVECADLAKPGEAAELARRILARTPRIDILVNNAATILAAPQTLAGDDYPVRKLFELNYWSPIALTRALVPQMEPGSAAIVNISSLGAVTPAPLTAHYAASKAALSISTTMLRRELKDVGVRVLLVLPGFVDTEMFDWWNKSIPGGRTLTSGAPVGTSAELAKLIADSIEKDRHVVAYPRIAGIGRFLPLVAERLNSFMARSINPRLPQLIERDTILEGTVDNNSLDRM